MRGRALRSLALLATCLALGSCNRTATEPASSCVPITGKYTGTFEDSCGRKSTMEVTLFVTGGCAFVGELPGFGTIQGTVDGAVAVFTIGFTGCSGSASGSASLTPSGGWAGTYSGNATGGAGCCGALTGTVTLARQ